MGSMGSAAERVANRDAMAAADLWLDPSWVISADYTPAGGVHAVGELLKGPEPPTAIVAFDDCRIPAANLLGKEGDGFRYAMMGLDGGRLNIAACSLGGARLALETTQAYVTTRKQFGKSLADFQNTQFKLADMATGLEACRLMVLRGAWAIDTNHPEKTKWCAMAKRMTTDACFQIADEALQLHGGYGYLKDYPLERIVRDLRVHRILEGTNEIMRVIIARRLLGDPGLSLE